MKKSQVQNKDAINFPYYLAYYIQKLQLNFWRDFIKSLRLPLSPPISAVKLHYLLLSNFLLSSNLFFLLVPCCCFWCLFTTLLSSQLLGHLLSLSVFTSSILSLSLLRAGLWYHCIPMSRLVPCRQKILMNYQVNEWLSLLWLYESTIHFLKFWHKLITHYVVLYCITFF